MDRAELSRTPEIRSLFISDADLLLSYFAYQAQLINSAWKNLEAKAWPAFSKLITWLSRTLGLDQIPIPMLGGAYFTSSLYREQFQAEIPHYYLTSADAFDETLYWPLMAHELAHCKLNETSHVKTALREARKRGVDRKLGAEACQRRLEQVLCDVLATRLLGPAFALSFAQKLEPVFSFPLPIDEPSFQLRLECIASTLEDAELTDTAKTIRSVGQEHFETDWNDDPLAVLKLTLIRACDDQPVLISKDGYAASMKACSSLQMEKLPSDPVLLFQTAWLSIASSVDSCSPSFVHKLSESIMANLERLPGPGDSGAQV
jgi:hypothetical protein